MAAGGHQGGDTAHDSERAQNLDQPHGPPYERVPEADRPAVVPHHTQTAGQLSERTPLAERLDRDRPAHQNQKERGDGNRAAAASSSVTVATVRPMDSSTNTVRSAARSMVIANARLGSLAGCNPSTTASPVTSSFIATHHPSPLFPAPQDHSLPS